MIITITCRYNGEPRTQQDLLLPLLTNFGLRYQKRKQPISLIVHLLKLDTTDLFIVVPSSLSSDKHTRQESCRFQDFLRNYIRSNNLAKTILHEVDTILVSMTAFFVCMFSWFAYCNTGVYITT